MTPEYKPTTCFSCGKSFIPKPGHAHIACLDDCCHYDQIEAGTGQTKEPASQMCGRCQRHPKGSLHTCKPAIDPPMGVSKWIEHGERYGYLAFAVATAVHQGKVEVLKAARGQGLRSDDQFATEHWIDAELAALEGEE